MKCPKCPDGWFVGKEEDYYCCKCGYNPSPPTKQTPPPVLCIDCYWYRPPEPIIRHLTSYSKCGNRQTSPARIYPVDGSEIPPDFAYCSSERTNDKGCGSQGIYFKAWKKNH